MRYFVHNGSKDIWPRMAPFEPWYQSLILRMETHLHNTVGCKYSYNFSVVVWI